MSRRFRLVLAGYGTVGKALHDMVLREQSRLEEDCGVRFDVVGIVRSGGAWLSDEGLGLDDLKIDARQSLDVAGVLERAQADALVEVTPTDLLTGGQGLAHCRQALTKGLHVVTANKGPVVLAYPELATAARDQGVQFRFEATAGAAMPLMSLKDAALRGDRVSRIDGVLNGTCNYILTRMGEEGLAFDAALQEAQALGYAEADPTADVGGHDAAAKVVILANHYFGSGLTLDQVEVTGITEVTAESVQLAMKNGYVVRLVASLDAEHGRVAPRLVPAASPLNVPGSLNVVSLHCENAGPIVVAGHGAGGRETAAAVLADLIAIAGRPT